MPRSLSHRRALAPEGPRAKKNRTERFGEDFVLKNPVPSRLRKTEQERFGEEFVLKNPVPSRLRKQNKNVSVRNSF
jgi:hypothetical protein